MAKSRIPLDFYRTHTRLTEAMLDHPLALPTFSGATSFVECCVGDGAISDVIHGRFPGSRVVTNDIDPKHPATHHMDAATPVCWSILNRAHGRSDIVISNPPFNKAPDIVPMAYQYAELAVVMLLRLSFAEPCKNRSEFLLQYPPTQLIVAGQRRPNFRPDGKGDNVTTAWFIWDKRHTARIGFITNGNKPWSE